MKTKIVILSAIFIIVCIVSGFLIGYRFGYGIYHSDSYKDDKAYMISNNYSAECILDFVKDNKDDPRKYSEGYNCVEYAMNLERKAMWAGLDCKIVALYLDDGSSHLINMFKSSDDIIFIDAIYSEQIFPEVSGDYHGRIITGIDVMQINWVSLDLYKMI